MNGQNGSGTSKAIDAQRPGKLQVLFLCTATLRAQMAEAWLRRYGADAFEVHSAGTGPRACVDPLAVAVMGECGLDMTNQRSKGVFVAGRFHGMTLDGFSDLDLSYTPPFGSP